MSLLGRRRALGALGASGALLLAGGSRARADDRLLKELIEFEAGIAFLGMNVPGMIVAAVRGDDSFVTGFGQRAPDAGPPDGDTVIMIGSLSKAFAGQVLAGTVASAAAGRSEVRFTDTLQQHFGAIPVPRMNARNITLLNLATHGSGLPREVERTRDPEQPDYVSRETYFEALKTQKLLFEPGTGLLYSNYAFDLLGEGLARATKKS